MCKTYLRSVLIKSIGVCFPGVFVELLQHWKSSFLGFLLFFTSPRIPDWYNYIHSDILVI